jgi:NAD(P)-dependent dehydrogenase (short-subunit alcohol dehydrogenase family)
MIVTGASPGLGAAIAQLAARQGYAVCVNYAQDEARANRVVDGIRAEGGMAIAVRPMSAATTTSWPCSGASTPSSALAALVNNAGISGHSRVDAMRLGDIARMFATNVFGTLLCSRRRFGACLSPTAAKAVRS